MAFLLLHNYMDFINLSDDYIIFHSVKWIKKTNNIRFGEADYIIFNKKFGIICLEVKHGAIVGENGRVYQINRGTKESFEINPMGQADRSKYYFMDILKPLLRKHNFSLPIYSAVWFTGIDRNKLKGQLPNEYNINGNVFFANDIQNINEAFKKCFKFYSMQEQNIPKLLLNNVRDLILPEFQVFPSMSNIVSQNEYLFNRMTSEQNYLLDYLEEQKIAAIQGGAGTGKTMLAIEKARRLSKNEKVVFLCFNSLLMDTLKSTYADELPNVVFTNLYSITTKAFKRNVNEIDITNFLSNFDMHSLVWDFKSIIIDEGQDFSNEQIELLKEIAILNDGSFYVFYDKNQLVQQRMRLDWLYNMDCRLVLSYNCRNTHHIAKTSSNPLGIKEVKMRFNIDGEMPYYHNTTDKTDLLTWLKRRIDKYTSEGLNLSQIVILTTKTIEKSILCDVSKIGKHNITYEIDRNNILFTTARKFKGLEADVVFLVDTDSNQFSDDESRRVFYVAASRAKSFLEIVPTLSEEEESDLFFSISNGTSRRNMSLISNLNVKPI